MTPTTTRTTTDKNTRAGASSALLPCCIVICAMLLVSLLSKSYYRQDNPQVVAVGNSVHDASIGVDGDNNNKDKNNPQATQAVRYYAPARFDQSGRQILRMLKVMAMAQEKYGDDGIFGGLCPYIPLETDRNFIEFNKTLKHMHKHTGGNVTDLLAYQQISIQQTVDLLHRLGWDKPPLNFGFACPTQEQLDAGQAVMLFFKRVIHWTLSDDWHRSLLQRFSQLQPQQAQVTEVTTTLSSVKQIAVHVRRGDISPCGRQHRYLSNLFFTTLLDTYLPQFCHDPARGGNEQDRYAATPPPGIPLCNVTIYSVNNPPPIEDFTDFSNRGYHVNVNGTLDQVFRAFWTADVLVVGWSAFSYVPAIWNPRAIIFPHDNGGETTDLTPFAEWIVLNENGDLMQLAEHEMERLQKSPECAKR